MNSNLQTERAKIANYRKELQLFLEESDQYNPFSLLGKINDNLIEERLILLRKAHDYSSCLNLLTYNSSKLTFEEVVKFCDTSYSNSREEEKYLQNIFKDLLIKIKEI